jgi:environmental stress-induced protein Ves
MVSATLCPKKLHVLNEADYTVDHWRNGAGVTTKLLQLPERSTHDNFEIRVTRAPINGQGQFSSYPGIERTITQISHNQVVLTFANGNSEALAHLVPFSFDSVLAPHVNLPVGPALVLNVMTRRNRWSSHVRVLSGETVTSCAPGPGELILVYSVSGHWLARSGSHEKTLLGGETLLVQGVESVDVAGSADAIAVIAYIQPVCSVPVAI